MPLSSNSECVVTWCLQTYKCCFGLSSHYTSDWGACQICLQAPCPTCCAVWKQGLQEHHGLARRQLKSVPPGYVLVSNTSGSSQGDARALARNISAALVMDHIHRRKSFFYEVALCDSQPCPLPLEELLRCTVE